MKCIKCDKCGRLVDGDTLVTHIEILESQYGLVGDAYDLCADCTLKLTKWLDDKDKRE